MLNADVSESVYVKKCFDRKLSNVEHRNFRLIQEMVYKMAKKLSTCTAAVARSLNAASSTYRNPTKQYVL